MAGRPAVLVTRPAGQGDALCERIARAGFPVSQQPLLAVAPLPPPDAAQRQLLLSLDRFRHCIFISSNAARFGLERILDFWPQWPAGLLCYAVGDSTAAVLSAAGLSVLTPGLEMTSEGLLALPSLQDVAGEQVLIVKGEGGRQALRETLEGRGASVRELACYRRLPPAVTPEAFARRIAGDAVRVILVSSAEALANLSALLRPGEAHNLPPITLVVPSARVAAAAAAAGWTRVHLADNAADDAMVAALERWWSDRGDSE